MKINGGAEGPTPDRQLPAATQLGSGVENQAGGQQTGQTGQAGQAWQAWQAGQTGQTGQSPGVPQAGEPRDAAGYGVVTSISDEARVAAARAENSKRGPGPSIHYIFEQGLAFAHQAVDRRRLARAVRKQVESEAVGQANRLAALEPGRARDMATRAGAQLRKNDSGQVA